MMSSLQRAVKKEGTQEDSSKEEGMDPPAIPKSLEDVADQVSHGGTPRTITSTS